MIRSMFAPARRGFLRQPCLTHPQILPRRTLFGFGKKEAEDALASVSPEDKQKLQRIATDLQQMMADTFSQLQNPGTSQPSDTQPNPMEFLQKLQDKIAEAEKLLPPDAKAKMKDLAGMITQSMQDVDQKKDDNK